MSQKIKPDADKGAALIGEFGPDISSFTLDNGLDVVVIPDHRVPVVTHMIWYRNGSADDPIGHSGIAHFLEHLMFKGTAKHPEGAFSKVVSALGGQENAFTSYDYTAYFQRIASEHLETMMEFESDRMANLLLEESVIAPERDVVLEERRMRVETDPAAQLGEAMATGLFVHHPYGLPIIGWMHEIETLGRTEAMDYYQRFYTPENAILVVAGDVTPETVRTMAEKTYGQIAPRARPPVAPLRRRPREPLPVAARRVTVADPKVEQAMVQRMYLTPSSRTAEGDDAHVFELLAEILGGGATSYLYRQLVLERAVAVNAGAWYMAGALDDTRFALYAIPAENGTLEAVEAELDAAILRAREEAFTDDAIAQAKTRLIAETVYSADSQTSMARIYGSGLAIGETIADIRRWPIAINEITRSDLQAVMERYLTLPRSVTGYLVKKAD